MPSPTWTRESIRGLLLSNDKAVIRAIRAIYALQTAQEQASRDTLIQNGVGFAAGDGAFFSKIVRRLDSGPALTAGEFWTARQRMLKYAGQLLEIAVEKEISQLCKQQ